jgi:hypothetical protein
MLTLALMAAPSASPAAAAPRSELIRSGFASRFTTLRAYWVGSDFRPVAAVVEGPVLTASGVVWAEQRAPGVWRILRAPLRGASTPAESTPYQPRRRATPSDLSLAASATRVAVGDHVAYCPPHACRGTGLSHIASWRFGARPQVLESCPVSFCGRPCQYYPPAAVTGDAVAYPWECDVHGGTIRVRDFAPGAADPLYEIPTASYPSTLRAAGRYLLRIEYGGSLENAHVYDLRTRRDVYSLEDVDTAFIQADGKVVYGAYSRGDRIVWASPADPAPHYVPRPRRGFDQVIGVARDRIAVLRAFRDQFHNEVAVYDLDGHELAKALIRTTLGQQTFDGQRIAFATQSCQTTVIAIWDIRDPAPPVESREPCPAAARASRNAVLTPSGWIRVRLRCPHAHRLGCAGRLHLVAFAAGHYVPIGTRNYDIPFDGAAGTSLRLSGRARGFLDAHSGARVFATTRSAHRTSVVEFNGPTRGHAFQLGVRRSRG